MKQTLNNLSKESIEEGALKALKQIEEKRYSQELINRGIKDIIKLAIVFKGKSVRIIQEENMGNSRVTVTTHRVRPLLKGGINNE